MIKQKQGFTLIEILLVIGIIVILAGAIIVAVNPGRQLAQTRNTQRTTDANAILNAIVQNITENQGRWNCPDSTNYSTSLPENTTSIVTAAEADNTQINLSCLVPNNISRLPVDPSLAQDSINTGYSLRYSSTTGRMTVCAVNNADLGRTICVQR